MVNQLEFKNESKNSFRYFINKLKMILVWIWFQSYEILTSKNKFFHFIVSVYRTRFDKLRIHFFHHICENFCTDISLKYHSAPVFGNRLRKSYKLTVDFFEHYYTCLERIQKINLIFNIPMKNVFTVAFVIFLKTCNLIESSWAIEILQTLNFKTLKSDDVQLVTPVNLTSW